MCFTGSEHLVNTIEVVFPFSNAANESIANFVKTGILTLSQHHIENIAYISKQHNRNFFYFKISTVTVANEYNANGNI